MIQLIPKILDYFPYWNRRFHPDDEMDEFCQQQRIIKIVTDLIDDPGEYCYYRETPYILINKFVTSAYRPWVCAHECGHHIFHTPLSCKFSASTRSKIEFEANIVAAGLLIPQKTLKSKTHWEIKEEFNLPLPLIKFREKMYRNYWKEEDKWLKKM